MRTLERNKTPFWYCLYKGKVPILDDGYETGETQIEYSRPISMMANISASSGIAQAEQFGNLLSYDKVIVTDDIDCPIDENTVLFVERKPTYDDEGNPLYDYVVKRIAKSLNSISIAISKVTVS